MSKYKQKKLKNKIILIYSNIFEKYSKMLSFTKNESIYKTERKTHPSFLRGWDVSDKR